MIYMYTFNYYLFINVYCSVNKITFNYIYDDAIATPINKKSLFFNM
jgi:hypothetical protein